VEVNKDAGPTSAGFSLLRRRYRDRQTYPNFDCLGKNILERKRWWGNQRAGHRNVGRTLRVTANARGSVASGPLAGAPRSPQWWSEEGRALCIHFGQERFGVLVDASAINRLEAPRVVGNR